jgi:hypothetical protein
MQAWFPAEVEGSEQSPRSKCSFGFHLLVEEKIPCLFTFSGDRIYVVVGGIR